MISNSGDGIDLKNSSNNRIHDNTIINSTNGIDTSAESGTGNIIYNNHVINSAVSHSNNSNNNKITTAGQLHGKLKHHHKQVVGNEPIVAVDFTGFKDYAKKQ
jgi:parallel beta-helix repeat protein